MKRRIGLRRVCVFFCLFSGKKSTLFLRSLFFFFLPPHTFAFRHSKRTSQLGNWARSVFIFSGVRRHTSCTRHATDVAACAHWVARGEKSQGRLWSIISRVHLARGIVPRLHHRLRPRWFACLPKSCIGEAGKRGRKQPFSRPQWLLLRISPVGAAAAAAPSSARQSNTAEPLAWRGPWYTRMLSPVLRHYWNNDARRFDRCQFTLVQPSASSPYAAGLADMATTACGAAKQWRGTERASGRARARAAAGTSVTRAGERRHQQPPRHLMQWRWHSVACATNAAATTRDVPSGPLSLLSSVTLRRYAWSRSRCAPLPDAAALPGITQSRVKWRRRVQLRGGFAVSNAACTCACRSPIGGAAATPFRPTLESHLSCGVVCDSYARSTGRWEGVIYPSFAGRGCRGVQDETLCFHVPIFASHLLSLWGSLPARWKNGNLLDKLLLDEYSRHYYYY